MALSSGLRRLAVLALFCTAAVSQPGQRRAPLPSHSPSITSPPTTSSSPSSTTAAPALFTTAVVPVYLFNLAESLLSEYFPSTVPSDLAQVSWPSTVVIGTATYGLDAKATTKTTTVTATPTKNTSSTNHSNQHDDEELAIILGCVIGFVVLALAAILFFCLRRRKEKEGSFFLRRSSPSTSSRGSHMARMLGGNTSYTGAGDAPAMAAVASQPNHMHHHRSAAAADSDEAPFFTPQEYRNEQLGHHQDMTGQNLEHGNEQAMAAQNARSRSSFLPAILRKPVPSRPAAQQQQNPFASPEDREEDDVVSPILPPSKFQRRKRSPQPVHYPSMSEVGEFDFAGDGSGRPNMSSNMNGVGPWYSPPATAGARHELM